MAGPYRKGCRQTEALPPAPVGVVLLQEGRRRHVQSLIVELGGADSLCTLTELTELQSCHTPSLILRWRSAWLDKYI